MDENSVTGAARNVKGKIEEGVGSDLGDMGTRIKGKVDQTAGAAQELYGQAADTAKDAAASLDDWFRQTIENQPYTMALVALGIGWLLGRMHRPY
jgi:uncharacterized protein YjbJ (UPF0337 family)